MRNLAAMRRVRRLQVVLPFIINVCAININIHIVRLAQKKKRRNIKLITFKLDTTQLLSSDYPTVGSVQVLLYSV